MIICILQSEDKLMLHMRLIHMLYNVEIDFQDDSGTATTSVPRSATPNIKALFIPDSRHFKFRNKQCGGGEIKFLSGNGLQLSSRPTNQSANQSPRRKH